MITLISNGFTVTTTFWLICAAIALLTELIFGMYYLLAVTAGLVVAAIAAVYTPNPTIQIMAGGFVMAIGVSICYAVRRSRARAELPATANPDVNPDIGQSVAVEWSSTGPTRVSYRGASWAVEAKVPEMQISGLCRIVEVHGSTLIVEPIPSLD